MPDVINLDPLLPYISSRGGEISRAQVSAAIEEIRIGSNVSEEGPNPVADPTDPYAATNAIRVLHLLGHTDFPNNGCLALSPPYWARLPIQSGFRAVLCGWMTSAELEQIKAKREQLTFSLFGSNFCITGIFIESGLPDGLLKVAEMSGAPITSSPAAWNLACAGEDITYFTGTLETKWSENALLPGTAQCFDLHGLRFGSGNTKTPGTNLNLWRWPGQQAPWKFALTKGTKSCYLPTSDITLAKHAVLSNHGISCLRYSPKSRGFAIPVQAMPPDYLARALTLCSGRLPQEVESDRKHWFVWRGVPPAVADQISTKLGQISVPKDTL